VEIGDTVVPLNRKFHKKRRPITEAMLSKAWIVFACSNTGIMDWNPFRGKIFICIYSVFFFLLYCEDNPLSIVSKIEELLGRNSSGSGLKRREYDNGDPLRWPRDTL
jgi:hypothetical protein